MFSCYYIIVIEDRQDLRETESGDCRTTSEGKEGLQVKKLIAILICTILVLGVTAFAEEKVTLHVVDINPDHDAYRAMIDAYNELYPNTVVETNHAVDDNAEVMSALMAANNAPNIFVATPEMTDVYGEYLYDWSQDEEILELFDRDYIDAIKEEDGAVYGLPNGCINVGLVYNKDVLSEAGYDAIPLTMSGFEKMCADVYEKTGVVPFVVSGHEGWMLNHMMDAYIITKEQPGRICAEKFNSGELKVSEASGHFNSFWRMLDIALEYTDGETMMEYDWEYTCNLLANGEVAIMTYGDWSYNAITKYDTGINLGFSSYPVSEDEAEAVTPTSVNQVAMLFKDVDHFEEAKALASFITGTKESAEYIIVGYGSVSCNKASAEVDPSLYNSLLGQSSEVAAAGRCVDRMQNYYPTIQGADFMGDAGEAIQGYLIGLYSEEEATAMIDEAWPVAE